EPAPSAVPLPEPVTLAPWRRPGVAGWLRCTTTVGPASSPAAGAAAVGAVEVLDGGVAGVVEVVLEPVAPVPLVSPAPLAAREPLPDPPACVGAGAWGVVSVTAGDWSSAVVVPVCASAASAPPARGPPK